MFFGGFAPTFILRHAVALFRATREENFQVLQFSQKYAIIYVDLRNNFGPFELGPPKLGVWVRQLRPWIQFNSILEIMDISGALQLNNKEMYRDAKLCEARRCLC